MNSYIVRLKDGFDVGEVRRDMDGTWCGRGRYSGRWTAGHRDSIRASEAVRQLERTHSPLVSAHEHANAVWLEQNR